MSEVVRTPSTAASRANGTWQLRPWPNDPDAALLVFVDHLKVPTVDDLDAAIAEAARLGVHTVRTSALFPRATEIALEHGFVAIDTLCLLRLALDEHLDRTLARNSAEGDVRLRPLRPWQHAEAALVDQDAFGRTWGNDAASIADVRKATPRHRARTVRADRRMVGFAICGTGGESGYVQRVAVATSHRRRGLARALVVDGLCWMRRLELTAAYVNTGLDNAAALALYEGLGFVRLDDRLTIVERRLGV